MRGRVAFTASIVVLMGSARALGQGYCSFDWTQRIASPAPAGNPGARGFPGIAYDPVGARVLMYGGGTSSAGFNDLRQWNGTSWSLLGLSAAVGIRKSPFFCYDTARQRAVLFGGAFTTNASTWEWNGVWTEAALAGPPLRGFGAMVYDQANARSVLFGGWLNAFTYFSDTWAWDGEGWTQLALAGDMPHFRGFHAMAYDASRSRIVMYGGLWNDVATSNYLGDTWEFDGTSWTQVFPATSPGARAYHAMGYDPVAQRVVLHGGFEVGHGQFNDMWTWDGSVWTQVASGGTAPVNRQVCGMAYDAARANFVVFGGVLGSTYRNDTWTALGTTGSAPSITTQPASAVACNGGIVDFEVVAAGTGHAYQWRHNGAPIFGATDSIVRIINAFGPDVGEYDCVVTSSCGSTTSAVAILTICFADLDDGSGSGVCDGGVDINDLLYFLAGFEQGDLSVDLDDGTGSGTPDNGVDINDLLFFLSRFEQGC